MLEIQPQHITLAHLFQDRLFRIPPYQRSYSWHRKQRQDLLADIQQAFDRGADRSHFMATVVGLRRKEEIIGTTAHQFIDIVDGQQRITTLILLLKAVALAIDNSDTIATRVRDEINDTLIKDDNATLLLLQTNHDSSDHFATYLVHGTHPPSKDAETIADHELLAAMEECEHFVASWQSAENSLVDLITLLKNRLTFILHEIGDESLVYTVFEVLNSRGLDVSWFDRLKTMLMAIIFDSADNKSEIIDTVHLLWTQIYDCVGLRLGLSTESLRFAATLRHPQCPSRPIGEEDAALMLCEQSKDGPEQVIATTRWLKDVTAAVDQLAANRRKDAVTRIAHARLVATAVHLRQDFTTYERDRILRRWEKVTFRIYGMFRKDARWAVGDYVRLAWRIVNEPLSYKKTLEGLSEIGNNFPVDEAVEHLRNTNCYTYWGEELRYFLHRYEEHLSKKAGQKFDNEQWRRIWAGTSARSIEHIRPQNWWIVRGRESDEAEMHGLGNLLLLPPGLNSKLQDTPAHKKVDAYTKTGLLIAQEVASMVSASGWGISIMKDREADLLKWAIPRVVRLVKSVKNGLKRSRSRSGFSLCQRLRRSPETGTPDGAIGRGGHLSQPRAPVDGTAPPPIQRGDPVRTGERAACDRRGAARRRQRGAGASNTEPLTQGTTVWAAILAKGALDSSAGKLGLASRLRGHDGLRVAHCLFVNTVVSTLYTGRIASGGQARRHSEV